VTLLILGDEFNVDGNFCLIVFLVGALVGCVFLVDYFLAGFGHDFLLIIYITRFIIINSNAFYQNLTSNQSRFNPIKIKLNEIKLNKFSIKISL
jgi:hypothetical protein